MASLMTSYDHWRKRRSRSPGLLVQKSCQTNASQKTTSPVRNATPSLREDASGPPGHPATALRAGTASQSGNAQAAASSDSWRRALEIVKKSAEWNKCCEIVNRKAVADLSQPLGQSDPLQKVAEIEHHVKQLVNKKEESKNTGMQKFLDRTITTLQVVRDVGSIATANTPYAALGWNIVSYIVSVVSAGRSVQKECFEELPRVLDLTIRYQIFSFVYSVIGEDYKLKPQLEAALDGLFAAILRYQVAVVISLYSKMTKLKISATGGTNSIPRAALEEVRRQQEAWESLEPAVNRELNDVQFGRLHTAIRDLQDISSAALGHITVMERKLDRQERANILNWVSPFWFADAHNEPKRLPVARTTDWLLKLPDYVSWVNDPAPSSIWLQGPVGAGKTCLSHAVIDDQIARSQVSLHRRQVLYFYCDATSAEGRARIDSHDKILRCFVRQIADSNVEDAFPASLLDAYDDYGNRSHLTTDQCMALLVSMSDTIADTTIVLDGLDECQPEVQRNLVKCLKGLRTKLPLRLLIASRPAPDLQALVEGLTVRRINVTDHTEAAIRTFIKIRVDEALREDDLCRLYQLGTTDLAPRVISKLSENADGMFQWVDAALHYLHKSRNAHALKNRLEDLRDLKVLHALYDRIWNETVADMKETEKLVLIMALSFVLHGVSKDLLQVALPWTTVQGSSHVVEACAFVSEDRLVDTFRVIDVITLCPDFIITASSSLQNHFQPEQDNSITLRIPHVSVSDYLISRHPESFSPAASHGAIAALCMRLFVESSIVPDVTSIQSYGFLLYAITCWQEHAYLSQSQSLSGKSADSLAQVTQTFLLNGGCPAPFRKWNSFMKHVQCHNASCVGIPAVGDKKEVGKIIVGQGFITEPPSTLFARIYLGLSVEDLVDEEYNVQARWSGSAITPQTFAAVVGRPSAIAWLAARGLSPNEQDERGETAGHILCTEGLFPRAEYSFPSTLRALLDAGLDLSVRNHAGNTCFLSLLRSEHVSSEVLRIFQSQGLYLQSTDGEFQGGTTDLTDHPQLTRLEFVVSNIRGVRCREQTLDAVFSHLADEFPDSKSRTRWLCLAAKHGEAWLANHLMEHYDADPALYDDMGALPLQRAMEARLEGHFSCATIDTLALATLKPGFAIRKRVGLRISVFEALLSGCTFETVKLFVEYLVPVVPEVNCAWGPRPITLTLLFNAKHGRQIAHFFQSQGCLNSPNSKIYYNWQLGRVEDEDIGRERWCSPDEFLAEDEITADSDAEEEFWDARETW